MPRKRTLLREEEITYEKLAGFLEKLGFVERKSKDPSTVRVFECSHEPEWVFLFPGGDRFNKPVEEWNSVRAHLDHWGILEATTVEELIEKLQQ